MPAAGQLWAGSYTPTMGGSGEGIGALLLRGDDSLGFAGVAAQVSSPSFLANGIVPGVIYVTDEANGRVEAFRRTADTGPGVLTLESLGGQGTTGASGASPCHISVTADRLYVANYTSGAVDVFPVLADGRIGPLETSFAGTGSGPHPAQGAPHAHGTLVVGDTVLSADLGSDQLHVHRRVDGELTRVSSASMPPGTGPRDFVVAPDGRIFVLGELSGAILEIDENGRILRSGQAVASPVAGDHLAALAIDADGRFLYTGLRGSNRIAVVDSRTLTPVADVPCGGDWPRHLVLSGELLHVANERSSTVASFRIDRETGIPEPLGRAVSVPTPTYLLAVV